MTIASASNGFLNRRSAVKFIVLLGLVSMFSDMTYESARSINGPYLALLGASATMVGVIAGFGELIGYAIRLASGYLSDKTGGYWPITISGYIINLISVPLLALADQWQLAAVLIIVERMGRAIRSPARDAMLSHAAGRTGLGWGFGLHEALDQGGAILGPLALAAVLVQHTGDYRTAYTLLAYPAVAALVLLTFTCVVYPRPRDFDLAPKPIEASGLRAMFWIYMVAVGCIAAGYADFALISYHFQKTGVLSAQWIPMSYSVAMATDAAAALILGRAYDRIGARVMIVATILAAVASPLVFFGTPAVALVGMACWGVGMGAQESVMRAVVAHLAPNEKRGTAYGIMNAVYGIAWFGGSATLGFLYDRSIAAVVIFSLVLQLAAVPLFLWLVRGKPGEPYARFGRVP
jgi:MFS family permease